MAKVTRGDPVGNDEREQSEEVWFAEFCKAYNEEELERSNEPHQSDPLSAEQLLESELKRGRFWEYLYKYSSLVYALILATNIIFLSVIAWLQSSSNGVSQDILVSTRSMSWLLVSAVYMIRLLALRYAPDVELHPSRNSAPSETIIVAGSRLAYMMLIFRFASLVTSIIIYTPFQRIVETKDSNSSSVSSILFDLLIDSLESFLFLSLKNPLKHSTSIFCVLCMANKVCFGYSSIILTNLGATISATLTIVSCAYDLLAYIAVQLFISSEIRSFEAFVGHRGAIHFLQDLITVLSIDLKLSLQSILKIYKVDIEVKESAFTKNTAKATTAAPAPANTTSAATAAAVAAASVDGESVAAAATAFNPESSIDTATTLPGFVENNDAQGYSEPLNSTNRPPRSTLNSSSQAFHKTENVPRPSKKKQATNLMPAISTDLKIISLLTDDLMILTKIEQGRSGPGRGSEPVNVEKLASKISSDWFMDLNNKNPLRVEIKYDFKAISGMEILCNRESITLLLKNIHLFLISRYTSSSNEESYDAVHNGESCLGPKSEEAFEKKNQEDATFSSSQPQPQLRGRDLPVCDWKFRVAAKYHAAKNFSRKAQFIHTAGNFLRSILPFSCNFVSLVDSNVSYLELEVQHVQAAETTSTFFKDHPVDSHTALLTCARTVQNEEGFLRRSEQGDCIKFFYKCDGAILQPISPPANPENTRRNDGSTDTHLQSSSPPVSPTPHFHRPNLRVGMERQESSESKSEGFDTHELPLNHNSFPKQLMRESWTRGSKSSRVCVLSDSSDDQNFISEILKNVNVPESNIVYLLSINDDKISSKYLRDMTDVVVLSNERMLNKLRNNGYDGFVVLLTAISAYMDSKSMELCDLVLPVPCSKSDEKVLFEWFEKPVKVYHSLRHQGSSRLGVGSVMGTEKLGSRHSNMRSHGSLKSAANNFNSFFGLLGNSTRSVVVGPCKYLRSDVQFIFVSAFILMWRDLVNTVTMQLRWGKRIFYNPISLSGLSSVSYLGEESIHDIGKKKFNVQYTRFGVFMFSDVVEESLCKWRILTPTIWPTPKTYFIIICGLVFVFLGLSEAPLNRSSGSSLSSVVTIGFGLLLLLREYVVRTIFFGRARFFWNCILFICCIYFCNNTHNTFDTFYGFDSEVIPYETVAVMEFGISKVKGSKIVQSVSGSLVVGWAFNFPWPYSLLLPVVTFCNLMTSFFVCLIRFTPLEYRALFFIAFTAFYVLQIICLFFYEQRNRIEFILLRKNQFSNVFLRKLFNLFVKDIRGSIGAILQTNRQLLDVLAEHILNLERRFFNPDLLYQISQYRNHYDLLRELYTELDLKHSVEGMWTSGAGDAFRMDIVGKRMARISHGPRQTVNVSLLLQSLARSITAESVNESIVINVYLDIDPSLSLIICDTKVLRVCCSNALTRACKLSRHVGAQRLVDGMVNCNYHIVLSVKPQTTKGKVKFNDCRLMCIEVHSSAFLEMKDILARSNSGFDPGSGQDTIIYGAAYRKKTQRPNDLWFKNSFGDHICKALVLNIHEESVFESFPDIRWDEKSKSQGRSYCNYAAKSVGGSSRTKFNASLIQSFTIPYLQHPESFTPQAKNFGVGWCNNPNNPIAVESDIVQISESCNRWLNARAAIEGNVFDNTATHELNLLIVGPSLNRIPQSNSSFGDDSNTAATTAQSRPSDRRIGTKFYDHGWVCRYVSLDYVAREMTRSELSKANCICFNTSETLTQIMIARVRAAAPHAVLLGLLPDDEIGDAASRLPVKSPSITSAVPSSEPTSQFDYECQEKGLDELITGIAESCIKAKIALLFPQ